MLQVFRKGVNEHHTLNSKSFSDNLRQAHLRSDLRGDPRGVEGVPGERYPRCRHLHRARQEKDRHRHGRCVRAQMTGTHLVRLQRINAFNQENKPNGSFKSHTHCHMKS